MKSIWIAALITALPAAAFAQGFSTLHSGATWDVTLLGSDAQDATCSLRNTTGGEKWFSLNANTAIDGDFLILGDTNRSAATPAEIRLLVQFDEGVRYLRPGFETTETVMFFLPAQEDEGRAFQVGMFNAETIRIRRLDDNSVVTFRSEGIRPALTAWADCAETLNR